MLRYHHVDDGDLPGADRERHPVGPVRRAIRRLARRQVLRVRRRRIHHRHCPVQAVAVRTVQGRCLLGTTSRRRPLKNASNALNVQCRVELFCPPPTIESILNGISKKNVFTEQQQKDRPALTYRTALADTIGDTVFPLKFHCCSIRILADDLFFFGSNGALTLRVARTDAHMGGTIVQRHHR